MSLDIQLYCLYGIVILLNSVNLHFALLIRRMVKSDLLFRKTVVDAFKESFSKTEELFDTFSKEIVALKENHTSAKFHQVPTKMEWSEANSHRDEMVKTVCKKCGKVFETARVLAETESMLCATCFQEEYLGKFNS